MGLMKSFGHFHHVNHCNNQQLEHDCFLSSTSGGIRTLANMLAAKEAGVSLSPSKEEFIFFSERASFTKQRAFLASTHFGTEVWEPFWEPEPNHRPTKRRMLCRLPCPCTSWKPKLVVPRPAKEHIMTKNESFPFGQHGYELDASKMAPESDHQPKHVRTT